jgi:hypothetical protein
MHRLDAGGTNNLRSKRAIDPGEGEVTGTNDTVQPGPWGRTEKVIVVEPGEVTALDPVGSRVRQGNEIVHLRH